LAVRSSKGGPELPVENPAFILVDIDGVPSNVSGGGLSASASQTTDAVRDALNSSRYIFATARSNGNGYQAGEKVIIFFSESGQPVNGYNTDSGTIIPSINSTTPFITGVGDLATSMAEAISSIAWIATKTTANYTIGDTLFLKKDISGIFVWCVVNATGQISVLNTPIPAANREEISSVSGVSGFLAIDPLTNDQYFISTVGGVPKKAVSLETGLELPSIPTGLSSSGQKTFLVGTAKKAGAGYSKDDRVLLGFGINGVLISADNIDTGAKLTPPPPAKDFHYSTIESANNSPTIPTSQFFVFTDINLEQDIDLIGCKGIEVINQSGRELRYGWDLDQCMTPLGAIISATESKTYISDIYYTGKFCLAAAEVPDPVTINNVTITANQSMIGGVFTNVEQGQLISGLGIPNNTYIRSVDKSKSLLTLCDSAGAIVMATTSSTTAQVVVSGAVVRLTFWT